jgi:hypothetical protein
MKALNCISTVYSPPICPKSRGNQAFFDYNPMIGRASRQERSEIAFQLQLIG